jgi:hypothetical protein
VTMPPKVVVPLAAAMLLVWVALVYGPTVSFQFVSWDDAVYVTEDPLVIGEASAKDRLLTPGLGYPIPLTVLSYNLNHAVAGLSPWIYHGTNVLLHGLNVLLVFFLSRKLGLSLLAGFLSAALFALHPITAEPVSWITGRKDLLAVGFSLAAVFAFLRVNAVPHAADFGCGTEKATTVVPVVYRLTFLWRWILTPLLFAFAMASKPTAVALLPILWLFAFQEGRSKTKASSATDPKRSSETTSDDSSSPDHRSSLVESKPHELSLTTEKETGAFPGIIGGWKETRFRNRLGVTFQVALRALGTVALPTLLALVFLIAAFTTPTANEPLAKGISLLQSLREAWFGLGFHGALMLFLNVPSCKYLPEPWPPVWGWTDAIPLIFVGLAALSLRLGKQQRAVFAAAWGWVGFSLLPVSGLLPLTRQLADSYLYMPLVGFSLIAGAGFDLLNQRLSRAAFITACIALALGLCALGFMAHSVSSKWQDSEKLWGQAQGEYPNDFRICRNLGNARFDGGNIEAALNTYEACAKRFGKPPFAKNIGLSLLSLGRHYEAYRAFLESPKEDRSSPLVQHCIRRIEEQRACSNILF